MVSMNEKEWAKIFKALGNENRIKIIELLSHKHKMSVSEIKRALGISFKWTSVNLNNLKRVGILESEGRKGQVFYYINPKIPGSARRALRLFLRKQ